MTDTQYKLSRDELVSLVAEDPDVVRIAEHIRKTDDYSSLPILADALEDAGFCDTAGLEKYGDWLEHLREHNSHSHPRGDISQPWYTAGNCAVVCIILHTAGRLDDD